MTTTVNRKVGVKFQFRKEYYWHIIASNGRIIARSSETYFYDHCGQVLERKSIVGKV